MKRTERRWLSAAFAAIGAGALVVGGAVVPAAADDTQDAVELQSVADKYEFAAAQSGSSAEELQSQDTAGVINVSDRGFFYFNDQLHASSGDLSTLALPAAPEGAAVPGTPAEGSRPGAPVTVYLDFDGETLEGTQWNADSGIDSLVFEPAASVTNRNAVWAAVAEDYAPFNVNVTTTRPSDDQLYKTSLDDDVYGSHVIITDSYDEVLPAAAGNGGIAWLGGTGSEFLSGALVFTEGTEGSPKTIAEIAAHESGHNFGLEHDGISGEDGEYYVPEEGVWAPIMGAGYFAPVTQWSAGEYAGATNTQDDLATITDRSAASALLISITLPDGTPYTSTAVCVPAGSDVDLSNPQPGDVILAVGVNGDCNPAGEQLVLGFTYRDRADYAADTVGNDAANAAALNNDEGTFSAAAVIVRTGDVDVYAVTTAGGELSATVQVADISPNLDAKLTVTDASGAIVGENDPASARESESVASGLNASVAIEDLEAGVYYLTVEGVGSGNPANATVVNANGYTAYGSLGNYTLTGEAEPFDSEPLIILTPTDGAGVAGGEDIEVTGTATPDATVTLSVGGALVDTVTANAEGEWSGNVTVNLYGPTEIVAAQTVGTIAIPGTTSVTVVAPPAPLAIPTVTSPTSGSTVDVATPTITGTGTPGAVVTVTITNVDDDEIIGQTVVGEDGTWAFTVGTPLADGAYAVSALQTLGDQTSESSDPVAFTVAAATGNGGNSDDNLAQTGGDFNPAPFVAGAIITLLVGGGILLYARRKSLSLEV